MDTITLTVFGDCQPAGSKKAYMPKNARFPVVVDANPKAAGWKGQVAKACAEQYGGPFLEGALEATIRFYTPRPRNHYGTGRNANTLKHSAAARPAVAPDVDKLSRAILDGLQGQLYRNDAQVVDKHAHKHYGEPARCEIEVTPLEAQRVVDALREDQLALVA